MFFDVTPPLPDNGQSSPGNTDVIDITSTSHATDNTIAIVIVTLIIFWILNHHES
jgi:hypothetical protein